MFSECPRFRKDIPVQIRVAALSDIKVHAEDRKKWRAWLRRHHIKETKVWLIKHKRHTKKPAMSHRESMEDAICFGWIDTTVKRVDDDTYANCFVKRNKNSRWSNSTLAIARKMIAEKKMSVAGLEAYKAGLKKPVIDHNLPRNPKVPIELKKLLDRNKKAKENFDNFALSYKRMYIYWIETAKRKETRDNRVKEVFKRAKENRKLF